MKKKCKINNVLYHVQGVNDAYEKACGKVNLGISFEVFFLIIYTIWYNIGCTSLVGAIWTWPSEIDTVSLLRYVDDNEFRGWENCFSSFYPRCHNGGAFFLVCDIVVVLVVIEWGGKANFLVAQQPSVDLFCFGVLLSGANKTS